MSIGQTVAHLSSLIVDMLRHSVFGNSNITDGPHPVVISPNQQWLSVLEDVGKKLVSLTAPVSA